MKRLAEELALNVGSHEGGSAEAAFDQFAPDFPENAPDIFRALREQCPVARSPLYGGFVIVTRYADVARVVRDDTTFSSAWIPDDGFGGITIPANQARHGFIEMDPPDSTMYRRVVSPLFSPAAVERMLPSIRAQVTEAIDSIIEAGSCDFAQDLADRVPAVATLDLLGLPVASWRRFVDYFHHKVSDKLASSVSTDYQSDNWLYRELGVEIRDRRNHPRADGLSWIVNQPIDGQLPSVESIVEHISLLLIGGLDTTAALLTNTIKYLSDHPEARQQLMDQPELMSSACEEFLRYFSPVQNLARTATADCDIGGTPVSKGERVLVSWASGNRDAEQFDRADEVILDRFPNRHQSFGLGSHRCAGSHLARAEWQIIIAEVLRRMPDFKVVTDGVVRYKTIASNNGWVSMPIVFTPGVRELDERSGGLSERRVAR